MMSKGKKVLIRTVTYFHVGEIEKVTRSWVYLKGGSWVSDTGRFSVALGGGTLGEVEKIPGDGRIMVSRAAIVDVFAWTHDLPSATQ